MKNKLYGLVLASFALMPLSASAKALASPETIAMLDKTIEAVNDDIKNFDSFTDRKGVFMAEPDLKNLKLIKGTLDKVRADIDKPKGENDYQVTRRSFFIVKSANGNTYKKSPFPFPCVAIAGCIKPPSSGKSKSYNALLEFSKYMINNNL